MPGDDAISTRIGPHPDPDKRNLQASVGELQLSEIDELKEEYNFSSRSETIRCLIQIGLNSIVENDPRNVGTVRDPSDAATVRDFVPRGKNEAIPLIEGDGETQGLVEKIEDDILDIIDEDEEIKRDGWKVYR